MKYNVENITETGMIGERKGIYLLNFIMTDLNM